MLLFAVLVASLMGHFKKLCKGKRISSHWRQVWPNEEFTGNGRMSRDCTVWWWTGVWDDSRLLTATNLRLTVFL